MICAIISDRLSLIFVPLLTVAFILGLIVLLWPRNGKNKTFLLCRKIAYVGALLSSPKIDIKMLKKIKKSLRSATNISSSLAGDDFYELERVCVRITECYNITSALILTRTAGELETYKSRLKKGINEAVSILQDLNLIPDDMTRYEDDLIKKTKEVFSAKYKTEQAKKYLKGIEVEENKNDSGI